MKTIYRSILLFFFLMLFSFGQSAMAQISDTEILARVDSYVLSQNDLEEAIQGDSQGRYLFPEDRLDLLKELVRIVIFSNKAREVGLDKDPELQRIISKIVNFHLARAYVEKYVKDAVQVSEDETQEWYENHRNDFVEPAKVRIRQIFLHQDPQTGLDEKKKDLAQLLLERIQQGEDFGALSATFSDDDDLRMKSGDLGYIARGALSPEYEDTVFSLDIGQVSPVLKGIYGYSIFKSESRKPERVMRFDEVRDTVIEILTQEKQNQRFLEIEKQLYDKYQVQVFEENVE